jgi:signal peptidase I
MTEITPQAKPVAAESPGGAPAAGTEPTPQTKPAAAESPGGAPAAGTEFTPRSKGLAAAANVFIPGLGALYAGFPSRGVSLAGAGMADVLLFGWLADTPLGLVASGALSVALWVFLFVDALRCVRLGNERATPTKYNRWYWYAAFVVVSLAVANGIRNYRETSLIAPFAAPGADNEPTLHEEDRFFADLQPPNLTRGDMIVYETGDGGRYVKRLIGLPGDVVTVDGLGVSLNGVRLPCTSKGAFDRFDPKAGSQKFTRYEEQLGDRAHDVIYATEPAAPRPTQRWTVPADAMFVLGDNRDFSVDSRASGPIPKADVRGKILYIYWPLMRFGATP